jgi:hypothetical protein
MEDVLGVYHRPYDPSVWEGNSRRLRFSDLHPSQAPNTIQDIHEKWTRQTAFPEAVSAVPGGSPTCLRPVARTPR